MIENYGFFLEKNGFPPVAARIYAFLILTEPHEFHFDQIRDSLLSSKGAISGALRFLEYSGRVSQKTKPGERKRYYCLAKLPGFESLAPFKKYIQTMKEMSEFALAQKKSNDDYISQFEASIRFCEHFLELLAEMEARHGEKTIDI